MAKPRRSSSRSKKKSHGVVLLIVGLLLGGTLVYGAQYYLYHDGKPFRGLAGLLKSDKKFAVKVEDRKPEPETERPPKPKLDFYTILPGETVLPEPKPDRKSAKAEPPEKGVSYVLQAASYGNLEDADRLKAKLVLNGLEAHIEKVVVEGKGTVFRVRLGPYSHLEELDAANGRLSQLGLKAMRLKVKKAAG